MYKKRITHDVLCEQETIKLISHLAISSPSKKEEAYKNNALGLFFSTEEYVHSLFFRCKNRIRKKLVRNRDHMQMQ